MSTNNYYYNNILIVNDDIEGDDFGDMAQDSINYTAEQLNIAIPEGFILTKQRQETNYNRNFEGKVIFIIDYFTPNGQNAYKQIEVVVRAGYYSGYNYDYNVSDLIDTETEYKTIEKEIARDIKKIEKVLRANGTELTKLGTFSNGEAVYKVKK